MSDQDERPFGAPRPSTAWWSSPDDEPWDAPRTVADQSRAGTDWSGTDTIGRTEQAGGGRRAGSIVALTAVLALLVGGLAGGVAGYVAGRQEPAPPSNGVTLGAAPEGRVDRAPDSVAGIAARVLPGVVKVEVQDGGEVGTGTGFVIDQAGYIVTNNHVVAPAGDSGRIELQFSDKQTAEATIVGNKITVILNGKKIHDQVECNKATGSEIDNKVNEPGPIFLQGDHGTVSFRNLRIKELPKS